MYISTGIVLLAKETRQYLQGSLRSGRDKYGALPMGRWTRLLAHLDPSGKLELELELGAGWSSPEPP